MRQSAPATESGTPAGGRHAGNVHPQNARDHRQRQKNDGSGGEQHGLVHLLGAGIQNLFVNEHGAFGERLQLVVKSGGAAEAHACVPA